MRVLIAEDAEDLRDLLVLALSEAGWEVFAARDGRDALRVYYDAMAGYEVITASDGSLTLRACDAIDFDVLLLDVDMPRLNGIGVGVLVRYFEGWAKIPRAKFIYLTGYDDVAPPEQLLEAELAGTKFMNGYIKKPIDMQELIDKVNELVEAQL